MKKNTFASPAIESQSIEELSKQLLETSAQLYAANEQLQKEGWTVIRFWEKDITKDTDRCIQLIIDTIEQKRQRCF